MKQQNSVSLYRLINSRMVECVDEESTEEEEENNIDITVINDTDNVFIDYDSEEENRLKRKVKHNITEEDYIYDQIIMDTFLEEERKSRINHHDILNKTTSYSDKLNRNGKVVIGDDGSIKIRYSDESEEEDDELQKAIKESLISYKNEPKPKPEPVISLIGTNKEREDKYKRQSDIQKSIYESIKIEEENRKKRLS